MPETTGLGAQFIFGASTIGQVAGITPPGAQRDVVEIDDINPTDEIKRKIAGLIDAGEVSLTINLDYENSSHQALEAGLYSGAVTSCKIKYKDGKGHTFSAFVTGFVPGEIRAAEVRQAEVTLTVTSKSTYGVIA